MYIPSSLYPTAYQSIVSRARGCSDCTTFLLVAPDVDALCAARQLAILFKQDEVVVRIHPIAGYRALDEIREEMKDKEVRSLILLNLGNSLPLKDLFSYLPPSALIHVIDSHRPIELDNLFESTHYGNALFDMRRVRGKGRGGMGGELGLPEMEKTIVVWTDGEGDENREAVKEAWEAMRYEPESDEDDSDSDSDGDMPRPRSEDDDEDGEEEDENGVPVGSKRRRTSTEPRPLSRPQRHRYRAKMLKYRESGAFYGQSVAGQVFLLAISLERADTDAVWLAILGLTHQFSTNIIDRERYEGYIALLSDEVARLSTNSLPPSADPLASTGPNDRSIRPSEELRFCLFRHWNLYDSMYHSGYLGSKMKLWTERGRRNLSGMLAKMGCPLSESSETYQHMATDLKASLVTKIEALAPEYGLHDLIIPSFVRKSGYRTDLAASDCVEAVGALLEVATGVRLDFGNAVGGRRGAMLGGTGHAVTAQNGGREEWSEGVKGWVARGEDVAAGKENRAPIAFGGQVPGEDEQALVQRREGREKEWRLRNFWLAWDALDHDTTLLRSALPLSMALHRAVMDQGGYILEKQAIKSLRTYRLAIIKEGPDLAVFRHPATLLRLALWLVDAVRDLLGQGQEGAGGGKRPKSLPLVLASLNEDTEHFLVCGIVGAVEYGDVKKNNFQQAFHNAAARSNAAAKQESFEASVLEIRRDHLDKFLKELAMA